jgi:hypothetical protein
LFAAPCDERTYPVTLRIGVAISPGDHGASAMDERHAQIAVADEAEFENLANDAAVLNRVARVRTLPHFGLFLARLKAKRYISRAVDRLKDIIDDPRRAPAASRKLRICFERFRECARRMERGKTPRDPGAGADDKAAHSIGQVG